jgi:hypothetical protein
MHISLPSVFLLLNFSSLCPFVPVSLALSRSVSVSGSASQRVSEPHTAVRCWACRPQHAHHRVAETKQRAPSAVNCHDRSGNSSTSTVTGPLARSYAASGHAHNDSAECSAVSPLPLSQSSPLSLSCVVLRVARWLVRAPKGGVLPCRVCLPLQLPHATSSKHSTALHSKKTSNEAETTRGEHDERHTKRKRERCRGKSAATPKKK